MLKNKDEEYLQGPGSGKNITIGSYAFPDGGQVSVDSVTPISIPFDWTDKGSVKNLTGDIAFVLGIKGINARLY